MSRTYSRFCSTIFSSKAFYSTLRPAVKFLYALRILYLAGHLPGATGHGAFSSTHVHCLSLTSTRLSQASMKTSTHAACTNALGFTLPYLGTNTAFSAPHLPRPRLVPEEPQLSRGHSRVPSATVPASSRAYFLDCFCTVPTAKRKNTNFCKLQPQIVRAYPCHVALQEHKISTPLS